MSTASKVAVISVFFNRGYCVDSSVKSLLEQTYKDLLIVLVDDGSIDNTLEKMKAYEFDNRVRVISHDNQGFTRSIKSAIQSLSGFEFIAIHGSGDVSAPERIEKQLAYLHHNKSFVAVGAGRRIVFEGDNSLLGTRSESIELPVGGLCSIRNIFSQGEVMFRRSVYDEVGGYREYFKYAQDIDLWLRMNKVGPVGNMKDILYTEFSRIDGVRNDQVKRIEQAKYAFIARYEACTCRESCKIDFSKSLDENLAEINDTWPLIRTFLRRLFSCAESNQPNAFRNYKAETVSLLEDKSKLLQFGLKLIPFQICKLLIRMFYLIKKGHRK